MDNAVKKVSYSFSISLLAILDPGELTADENDRGICLLLTFAIIDFMKIIIRAAKSFNGIQVSFLSGNDTLSELFSYENLIDMKINATDLLDYPERYAVDMKGPVIVRTDFCNPKAHEECKS